MFICDGRTPAQIRALVVELLALKPGLMVSNTNSVTTIMLTEVRTVPLLFIGVADPVGSGYVTNVAHPTGNATGFANLVLQSEAIYWACSKKSRRKRNKSASFWIPSLRAIEAS